MPATMAYKCMALVYTLKTGEKVKTHKEREVLKRQHEVFLELGKNE